MPNYECEIHWEPSTIIIVEANSAEEADEQAVIQAGQPEASSVTVRKISD